jgi:hypothetical protein
MAAKNNGVALSTAVVAAPNLQPARRNQDAGAVQNEEATAQDEHVAETAVEFAGNRDVPYSQTGVLATNASKIVCQNAKEWEGRTRVSIEYMEEKAAYIHGGPGCLAGMLAEHETPL